MLILGIETSCDETSAAILEISANTTTLLSNVVASSINLHSKTGGIIPETAARQQLLYIMPVIQEAFTKSGINFDKFDVDKITVTYGPGLIGSLLIGVETARSLSYAFNKPLIRVNHLLGHIYANWLNKNVDEISFPAIGLIVSGGHTDLILMESHEKIKWLGGTRDDAAGEAFDKIGRLLGLPYPGGPSIEKMAAKGQKGKFNFPRPLADSRDFDFSFSGLKTAVVREVEKQKKLNDQTISDICLAVQTSIVDVINKKTFDAALKYNAESVLLGGGVAANNTLRRIIQQNSEDMGISFYVPELKFCTDNAAMIAAAAFFKQDKVSWQKLDALPSLHFQN